MTEQDEWDFINNLDEELLKGGVILSEWSVFLIQDADFAFAAGANLGALPTALAGIESHLKYEYGENKRERLIELIDKASIEEDLRQNLHRLRKYRNQWVHVDEPAEDESLLVDPEKHRTLQKRAWGLASDRLAAVADKQEVNHHADDGWRVS